METHLHTQSQSSHQCHSWPKCYYWMFCLSWIASSFTVIFIFVSSDYFFYFFFFPLSGWLFGMLPALITGFVFMCVLYMLTSLSVCMYVCLYVWCICLVLWPQSVSQYRTSLFSVPGCSAGSGSGIYRSDILCSTEVSLCISVQLPSCFVFFGYNSCFSWC